MKVTLLNGLYKIQKGHFELEDIFKEIQKGVYGQPVFDCRTALSLRGKKAYTNEKLNLPCFTPSGRFGQAWTTDKKTKEKRPIPPTKRHLIEYNGIVVLDYDDLEIFTLLALIDKVKNCKFTFACFYSPSGNGYKVLVRTTNKDPQQHANAFKAVRSYFFELTGVEDDKSSSNFNRLCFVSVDSTLLFNEDSTLFEFQPTLFEKPKKEAPTPSIPVNNVDYDCITKAINKIEKNGFSFVNGQRHEYRKQFAIECVKYGVTKEECLYFVENNLVTVDTNLKQAESVVHWAFENIKEVGIYATWAEDNGKTEAIKPKDKKEDYVPELYQASKAEEFKISIPELSADEILELDSKIQDSIAYQRIVEQTLDKFFDFRINILKKREEYRLKEWKEFKEMDKLEYNSISRALKLHGVKCTPAVLESVILSHFSKQVHPLKEKFEGWGNHLGEDKTDYIAQVAKLVKTDAPKDLFLNVFKKWIVASVANVFVEGHCTNHHCIILCGDQGTNKTTFFTSLFSPEYVFTGHIDLKNKDSMILLTDTFLVVLDEQFSVLNKEAEWEALKSAVTMPRIKARWHYAKSSKLAPRIANFCGTANRIEILQDDTGNRRFVPFQLTEPININELKKIDIRKMWAQAYKLFKENWFYLPTVKEKNQIDKYQQGFKKLANEHYLIMDMFEPYTKKDSDLELLSSTEIWKQLEKDYNLSKDVTVSKIGRAMHFLGFQQKTVTRESDKRRARYWQLKRR
ncbi:VapE domain-containing protein [Aureispira sp. CCB-E]|uniref:VapE domain-containing protein n=1 Tax=Aureispira sp. CCB-E TaxID=3051121 RepID=UPI002868C9B5|nr:VapE domain-containing protein [Aureispira sp. CCB-E]WMX16540.1 VapE family protein [Aureispira sp. CCB-E]